MIHYRLNSKLFVNSSNKFHIDNIVLIFMNTATLHVNVSGPSRTVLQYIVDNKSSIPLKWVVRKHPNVMDAYERDLLNKIKITKIPAMELAGDVFNSSGDILRCLRKLQSARNSRQQGKVISNRSDIMSGVKYEQDDRGRKKFVIEKEEEENDNFEKEMERKKREFKTPAHWGVSVGGTEPSADDDDPPERDIDITIKNESTDDGVIDNEWLMRNTDD